MALAEVVPMVPAPRAVSCSDLHSYDQSSGSQSEDGDCGLNPSRSELELSQGKDSGIDCGSDVSLPDEETSQKILQTVEFYFSDANIMKDQFLLKHVRRNKEGYVSLKLVSSFRKVRSLCRNWKAVAETLKKSETLALNDEGTKVRRVAPLPAICDKISSTTVLVYGLPGEKLSVEVLSDMFSKCGEIALIRILKSNSSTSMDIKKVLNKNPEIQSKGCGVIEFEELEGAKLALAMDTGKENCVRIIPVGNCSGNQKDGKTCDENAKTSSPKKKKRARRSLHGSKTNLKDSSKTDDSKGQKPRRSSSGSLGCGGNSSSSGYLSSSPADNWFSRRHSYNVPNGSNKAEPANTTSSFASLKNRGHYKGSKDRMMTNGGSNSKINETENNGTSGSRSPWRVRRELMRSEMSLSSHCLSLAVPLVRMPKGPDGTRGFQNPARHALPPTAE